ncbi:MAG TPA: biotin/lipoyl-binding protein, partial [Actinomycetota bacterium]|nr:biotin/lipoyl-binding protein [Actinomycetota bacterium]
MNSRQRRQRAIRRTVAAVVVLAVAGAGVGIGFAVWGGGPSGYSTGVATTASVEKTLSLSGVFEPVQQSAASFQVAGTVASVSVTVGQQVTAGQTLASLTSTALQDSLTSAQSNLSAAQAKLTQDESGEATTTSYVTGGSGGEPGAVLLADTATSLPTLAQAQQAVVTAQQTADADLQTAAADLAAAETACAGSSTTTGTVTSPVTGTAGSPVTGTSSTGPDAAACAEALTQAEAAQTQV